MRNDTICSISCGQHGLVARWQALRAGVPPTVFDGLVRRRHLRRVAYGVYAVAGAPATWRREALAAVLAAGPEACADGAVSCAIHGLEGFDQRGPVGALVPRVPGRRQEPSRARVAPIRPADVKVVDGIPILTAFRAIIEVAAEVSDKAVRVLIDSARRRGLISIGRLQRVAEALQPHPGALVVLAVLGSGAMDKESEGERDLEAFLAPLGMDLEWGVTDVVAGRRLDAFERHLRIGYEFDGRAHHVLPTDRDADALRDLECEVDGVLIIRITSGMMRDHPQGTIELIAAIRRRRAAELGLPAPA